MVTLLTDKINALRTTVDGKTKDTLTDAVAYAQEQIASAIKNKGTTVTATTLAGLSDDIENISTGTSISGVTATASTVLKGYDFVDNTGEVVHGEIETISDEAVSLSAGGTYDIKSGYHADGATITAKSLASQTGVDSDKDPVTASTMLSGYQGWVNGSKVTGTMTNRGAVSATITGLTSDTNSYTIPAGYHNGSGKVSLTTGIYNQLESLIDADGETVQEEIDFIEECNASIAESLYNNNIITSTSGQTLSSLTKAIINMSVGGATMGSKSLGCGTVTTSSSYVYSLSITHNMDHTPSNVIAFFPASPTDAPTVRLTVLCAYINSTTYYVYYKNESDGWDPKTCNYSSGSSSFKPTFSGTSITLKTQYTTSFKTYFPSSTTGYWFAW